MAGFGPHRDERKHRSCVDTVAMHTVKQCATPAARKTSAFQLPEHHLTGPPNPRSHKKTTAMCLFASSREASVAGCLPDKRGRRPRRSSAPRACPSGTTPWARRGSPQGRSRGRGASEVGKGPVIDGFARRCAAKARRWTPARSSEGGGPSQAGAKDTILGPGEIGPRVVPARSGGSAWDL